MKARIVISNLASMGGFGECNVYSLDEPYRGAEHIAVVVYGNPGLIGWQNAGVEVFACDELGNVSSMDTLYQSYLIESHAEVCARLGYFVDVE